MFNGNVKIINASLKVLIKVLTQKAKFYKIFYINQISQTNFKSFSNQRSDTASILSSLNSFPPFFSFCISFFLHETYFMLSILFKSHRIRHSGTGRAFKDTLKVLEHLRHSESTRALGHSESTQKALKALGHSDTYGPRAFGGHLGTWRALGHLRHLGTRTLRAPRHLGTQGTRALEALYLADSFLEHSTFIISNECCTTMNLCSILTVILAPDLVLFKFRHVPLFWHFKTFYLVADVGKM